MMRRIDAHQHFWTTSRDDYGWLTPELGPIYRDFQPHDLQPFLAATGVDRTLLVQAAQSEAETLYLLDLAAQTDFVAGVVGWVNLEAADAATRVAAMARRGVIGLRPMVQDIADTEWLLRPALRSGLDAMIAHDLRFDALVQPRHLPILAEFSQLYPMLKVVIDHGAKPDIANGKLQPWADAITHIARNTSFCCKLSGLVTEANHDWQLTDIEPFVRVLITAFGADRLMWGSDWPVLNLAGDYHRWHRVTTELLGGLSTQDRDLIFGGTAAGFYGLDR
jgi:L-fuconolactonase